MSGNLSATSNTRHIFVVISELRWVGHVARMGERRGVYTGFWWGNPKKRDYLGDPDIDGRIIIIWIFRK